MNQLAAQGQAPSLATPDGPVLVNGDLVSLERVFRNLVANALESVESRGATEVSTGLSVATGGDAAYDSDFVHIELVRQPASAEVRVQDRGVGISEEALPRIWEPDFTRKRRGTGLGLAFVRQVVLAHGGAVTASNRAGGGAELLVRLPLAEARGESGAP
ncbi:MAG TPA: ATP-binding protein [Vicinamibacteria bacterium]